MLHRRRVLLLSGAAALAAATAALAASPDDDQPARAVAPPAPRVGHWQRPWSARVGDVIDVHGRTCPKSHPHKVGSSSYTTVRVRNGRVVRNASVTSMCVRSGMVNFTPWPSSVGTAAESH